LLRSDPLPRVLPPLPRWDPWVLLSFTSPATAAFPVIMAGRLPQRHYEACSVFATRCGPRGWLTVQRRPFLGVLHLIRHLLSCPKSFRLERQFAGRVSHPVDQYAFARRT
jgi:hypothetical protein